MAKENRYLIAFKEWQTGIALPWMESVGMILDVVVMIGSLVALICYTFAHKPVPWLDVVILGVSTVLFIVWSFVAFKRAIDQRDEARGPGDIVNVIDEVGEEAISKLYEMRSGLMTGVPLPSLPSNVKPIIDRLYLHGLVEIRQHQIPGEIPLADSAPLRRGQWRLPIHRGAKTINNAVITDLGRRVAVSWETRLSSNPRSLSQSTHDP